MKLSVSTSNTPGCERKRTQQELQGHPKPSLPATNKNARAQGNKVKL